LNINFLKYYFFIILIILSKVSLSQDIHFSQFFNNQANINPALVGDYRGNWCFVNNYRRQWDAVTTPFITNSIAFDKQFFVKKERFNIGFNFLTDKSGEVSYYTNNFNLNLSYHKTFKYNIINFGFQTAYISKGFSLHSITFPDQYDNIGGTFSKEISTNEILFNNNLSYFDFSAGILYRAFNRTINPSIGFAAFHLTSPNESFFNEGQYKLPIRKVVNSKIECIISKKSTLIADILYMSHEKASNIVYGARYFYDISKDNNKIIKPFLGVYARNGLNSNFDATIFLIGVKTNFYEIALNYDYNISDLEDVSYHFGAIEISFIYRGIYTFLNTNLSPCERF